MPRKGAQRGSSTLPTSTELPSEPGLATKNKRTSARKRGLEADVSGAEVPPLASKKAKSTAPEPPTEEFVPVTEDTVLEPQQAQRCSNRSVPGPVIAPKRKRRTKAEMAAAREEEAAKKLAAEKGKKRLQEIAEEADRRLEMMDLDDDASRANMNSRTVRRLSEMVVESEDEFIAIDVSSDELSDDEGIEKKTYKQLEDELARLKAQMGGKKKGGRQATKTVAYASGILPGGYNEANLNDKSKHKSRKTSSQCVEVNEAGGGLNDSDAEAAESFQRSMLETEQQSVDFTMAETFKRDLSRQNNLVTEITSDDELTDNPGPPPKLRAPSRTKPAALKPSKPPTKIATKPNSSSKVDVPTSIPTARPPKAAKHPTLAATKQLTSNNVRVSDLPDFAEEDGIWRKVFLPTLFDRFFASAEPFTKFVKGSKPFIEFIQDTVDLVYPHVIYNVGSKCAIHLLAYNRINDKRSAIGSDAIKVIEHHLSTLSGKKEVSNWLNHALRADGPLYFQNPSPLGSPIDRRNPNYIHPSGRLLSPFILEIARPFLRLKSGSVSASSHPRGLFALVIVALERAIEAARNATTSRSKKITEFSNDFWGSRILTAYSSLGKISAERWIEVVEASCNVPNLSSDSEMGNEADQANLSLLDSNRGIMFDFSSPAKA